MDKPPFSVLDKFFQTTVFGNGFQLPQQLGLAFFGLATSDDPVNGRTNVGSSGGMYALGITNHVYGTDADYIALAADYGNAIQFLTSSVSLTATRKYQLPLVAGAVLIVANATTGAQSINFIGASGTGVLVGSGKTAQLWCNGTSWFRVSADV